MGMTMMPIMSAALATLSDAQVPDGSTLMNVIQQWGDLVGTAVISVVLASSLAAKPEAGLAIFANTSDKPLPGVPDPLPESFFDTAADVFSNTFLISVVLIACTLIPAFFLPRKKIASALVEDLEAHRSDRDALIRPDGIRRYEKSPTNHSGSVSSL